VLLLMLPALALCRRVVPERMLVITLSAIAACFAWRWMSERYQVLRQQQWPSLGDLVNLARWPALFLLVVGIGSLIVKWLRRKVPTSSAPG